MIEWSNLDDIVLQGVNDYPDMANAGIQSAYLPSEGRQLTEAELDDVQTRYAEEIQDLARRLVHG